MGRVWRTSYKSPRMLTVELIGPCWWELRKTTNLIKMQSKICACAVSEGYTRCYLVEEISIQYNIWVTVYCPSSDLHEREQNTEKKDVKKVGSLVRRGA